MSKIIRTRKPSVLPYYAAALAFVVLCAVLPVYRLWALLAVLGAAVLAFAGAKKICPPRVVETEVPFHTGVDDVDAMLTEMQQQLDTLHALAEEAAFIRDVLIPGMGELRAAADEAETRTAATYWPFPTYGDLLFGVK